VKKNSKGYVGTGKFFELLDRLEDDPDFADLVE
jgi:hypothetical protein